MLNPGTTPASAYQRVNVFSQDVTHKQLFPPFLSLPALKTCPLSDQTKRTKDEPALGGVFGAESRLCGRKTRTASTFLLNKFYMLSFDPEIPLMFVLKVMSSASTARL